MVTGLAAMKPVVALHLAVGLLALGLGIAVLLRTKGTGAHKLLGRLWVAVMAVAALSSFALTGVAGAGRYSWIHLLSVWVLISLSAGVLLIRRGDVRAHKRFMVGTFIGLCVAGAFALFGSGRALNAIVFGG